MRLCIAKNEGDTILTGYTFPIVRIEKPYIHIKSILVDGTDILIGSINLTENAIENNREVALIYRDAPELYQKIEDTFSHDCFPQKFAK